MRQNVKILLSVFLLMSTCMVMASPPYPESQNEDKTELNALPFLEVELRAESFYFHDFQLIEDTSDPERHKCKCEGYFWGSHSIECETGDNCDCRHYFFSCECRCKHGIHHHNF